LVGLLAAYTIFLIAEARRERSAERASGEEAEVAGPAAAKRLAFVPNLSLIAGGVGGLVLGSRFLVKGAVGLARGFGISEAIIGLTIVAVGTSLPELATSVVAALRGARDISIGNLIGSNIFNIFSVLGFSGLVARGGLAVAPDVLAGDIPLMVVVALACLPLFRAGFVISRWNGAFFFGSYVLFVVWTLLRATASPALGIFRRLIFDAVLPAFIIGVVVSIILSLRKEEAGRSKGGGGSLE
jgi:cation:H+ antiporter